MEINKIIKHIETGIRRLERWETKTFNINILEYIIKRNIILTENNYIEVLKILNKKYENKYKITLVKTNVKIDNNLQYIFSFKII